MKRDRINCFLTRKMLPTRRRPSHQCGRFYSPRGPWLPPTILIANSLRHHVTLYRLVVTGHLWRHADTCYRREPICTLTVLTGAQAPKSKEEVIQAMAKLESERRYYASTTLTVWRRPMFVLPPYPKTSHRLPAEVAR